MISSTDFESRSEAIELNEFNRTVMIHISNAEDRLQRKWFPDVQNIFFTHNKKFQSLSKMKGAKLQSFFNATAALMTKNLQDLALTSIEEYKAMVLNSSELDSNLTLIIRLVLDGEEVKFEPDLPDFFEYMSTLVDVIKKSVQVVPRVETKVTSLLKKSDSQNLKTTFSFIQKNHGNRNQRMTTNSIQQYLMKLSWILKLQSSKQSKLVQEIHKLIWLKLRRSLLDLLPEKRN